MSGDQSVSKGVSLSVRQIVFETGEQSVSEGDSLCNREKVFKSKR